RLAGRYHLYAAVQVHRKDPESDGRAEVASRLCSPSLRSLIRRESKAYDMNGQARGRVGMARSEDQILKGKTKGGTTMKSRLVLLIAGLGLACACGAQAQQKPAGNTASTASAQNRAASDVLPKQEQPFSDAKIGRTYKDSKPGTMALSKAPAGAPNVLIILIDDAGFGQWGTFGGQVPTPNLDRLAKMGLRYTLFHTTALCSPSRAALLTGRTHHYAGT